jgi:hypothetical protein
MGKVSSNCQKYKYIIGNILLWIWMRVSTCSYYDKIMALLRTRIEVYIIERIVHWGADMNTNRILMTTTENMSAIIIVSICIKIKSLMLLHILHISTKLLIMTFLCKNVLFTNVAYTEAMRITKNNIITICIIARPLQYLLYNNCLTYILKLHLRWRN